MKSIVPVGAVAYSIAQSATGTTQVVYFIAITLCFFLMEVVLHLLVRRNAPRSTVRRRRR
jgi:hypothetical protein